MIGTILERFYSKRLVRPDYKIVMYGSTINSTICKKDNDLDITILFDTVDIDQWEIMRFFQRNIKTES